MKIVVKNGLRYGYPEDGMWLTENNNDERNRVYSPEIIFGINDDPDNWRDATEEEKLEYEAAEKVRMEAEQAEYEAQQMSNQ